MASRSLLLLATFTALLAVPNQLPAEPATANEQKDLWEVTSKMAMEEMPMEIPAQTMKVCAAKEWKEPPGGADERQTCRNSDFKIAGKTATWTVTCSEPAMTGHGEITRDTPDTYSGAIKFTSDDGSMTINLNGRRLGGC